MGSIRISTEIPGPRSRELAERAAASVARSVSAGERVYMSHGMGAVVEDVDGNRYLDFVGGVGCLAVGHSHPRVIDAIEQQAARFTHTDFSLLPYESYLELSEKLSALCGGGRKVALFNSGAEAVENSVKVARIATGRPGIVCFEGAFHGRTFMALTLTHREVPHKRGMGPFLTETHRIPYPGFGGAGLAESLDALSQAMSGHSIAAVIVEPVLGEGGFVVPPREFLSELKEACRANGSLLICDEVQSGYGRTGTFLASEQSGTIPDISLVGKSIAAGLPLSALVGDPGLLDTPEPNALGGTFVGNPVACAVALAVLDVIQEEKLVERARALGEMLIRGWRKLASESGAIKDVRGLGSMVGVEFSDPAITRRFVEGALQRGVMLITAGKERNVIRHLMPLVIGDDQVAEALEVFGASLEVVA